ncbi:hypothetical protein D3C86_2017170 [compost metagenome]
MELKSSVPTVPIMAMRAEFQNAAPRLIISSSLWMFSMSMDPKPNFPFKISEELFVIPISIHTNGNNEKIEAAIRKV